MGTTGSARKTPTAAAPRGRSAADKTPSPGEPAASSLESPPLTDYNKRRYGSGMDIGRDVGAISSGTRAAGSTYGHGGPVALDSSEASQLRQFQERLRRGESMAAGLGGGGDVSSETNSEIGSLLEGKSGINITPMGVGGEAVARGPRYVLHPIYSTFRRNWDLSLAVLIFYNTLLVPYRIAYDVDAAEGSFWYVFDYFADALFMVDVALNFRTGYVDNDTSEVVMAPPRIAKQYAKTWLLLDIASAFPFSDVIEPFYRGGEEEADSGSFGNDGIQRVNKLLRVLKTFRLLRVLRVLRLNRILGRMGASFHIKYSVISIVKFAFGVFVLAHWIACLWFLVAQLEGYDGTWVDQITAECVTRVSAAAEAGAGDLEGYDDPAAQAAQAARRVLLGATGGYGSVDSSACLTLYEQSTKTQYITSIYHTIMMMSTIGSSIVPVTDTERIFSLFSMLCGASVWAYGITNMCTLIFNMNRQEVFFRQKMDELNDFMSYRELPKLLRLKIREYYDHLHNRLRFFDEGEIISELSHQLRQELILELNKSMVMSNAFFKGMPDDFVASIILKLRVATYLPGEVVVREGDVGDEMFFISEGHVEIIITAEDGSADVIKTLAAGDYVGEIALLKAGIRRTATVRALTFCDIYSLSRVDIDDVLAHFPRHKARWERVARHRLKELDARKRKLTVHTPSSNGRRNSLVDKMVVEVPEEDTDEEEAEAAGQKTPGGTKFLRATRSLRRLLTSTLPRRPKDREGDSSGNSSPRATSSRRGSAAELGVPSASFAAVTSPTIVGSDMLRRSRSMDARDSPDTGSPRGKDMLSRATARPKFGGSGGKYAPMGSNMPGGRGSPSGGALRVAVDMSALHRIDSPHGSHDSPRQVLVDTRVPQSPSYSDMRLDPHSIDVAVRRGSTGSPECSDAARVVATARRGSASSLGGSVADRWRAAAVAAVVRSRRGSMSSLGGESPSSRMSTGSMSPPNEEFFDAPEARAAYKALGATPRLSRRLSGIAADTRMALISDLSRSLPQLGTYGEAPQTPMALQQRALVAEEEAMRLQHELGMARLALERSEMLRHREAEVASAQQDAGGMGQTAIFRGGDTSPTGGNRGGGASGEESPPTTGAVTVRRRSRLGQEDLMSDT